MDIVTLQLSKLGEGCIVKNAQGAEFLDLSKVRIAAKGYNDQWELSFTVKGSIKTTATGKRMLSVTENQTQEQRERKEPLVYIGGGIRLFEDSPIVDNTSKPKSQAKATSLPMPSDLPM